MLKSRKGFTLIELLVVVAIIGILAALVLAAMGTARAKARDSQRKSDLRNIQTALELYADSNNGQYPATAGWEAALTGGGHMRTVPTDPLTPATHYVYTQLTSTTYSLSCTLEIGGTYTVYNP